MKLIHLSDLHLGKRVNEFSMIEDQRYILNEITDIIDQEQPDGILIAGDIYDKPVPAVEAVELLGDFLESMAQRNYPVFVISGNHDSAERLAFAASLIASSGVYISPSYRGHVEPVTLQDGYGPVDIYLLPFIKPLQVRQAFPEEEIHSYQDAVALAIREMHVDQTRRNVLVAHQFVTGADTCESEEIMVGGTDQVSAEIFAPFDYVALGHLHGPQKVERETVRYCGTPLKYSFSEASHVKSVTVVEMGQKGETSVRTVPLKPLHDMRECRGTYEELTSRDHYIGTRVDDYLHITLTDEEDIFEAVSKLRVIYPNLMKMDYDNQRTRQNRVIDNLEETVERRPLELVQEFYEKLNNQPLNDSQTKLMESMIEDIWGGR